MIGWGPRKGGSVKPKFQACKSVRTAATTAKGDSLMGLPDSVAYQPHGSEYLSKAQARSPDT